MFIRFFVHLRDHRVPVSIRELLDLLNAVKLRLAFADLEQFYFLARLCLVKDETYYDRFNFAFESFFNSLADPGGIFEAGATAEMMHKTLTELMPAHCEQELEQLLETYRVRLAARRERAEAKATDTVDSSDKSGAIAESGHPGQRKNDADALEGDEWRPDPWEKSGGPDSEDETGGGEEDDADAGEGDEDPGNDEGKNGSEGEGEDGETGTGSGDEPGQGAREQSGEVSHRAAIKVWQLRDYADYDPEVELGTRNMKLALRRLRKFARTSAELELDLAGTIRRTARNGGILDIREFPERHNSVKVLMFLDVGGSMDEHVERCAQLFSAARSEFKYLEYYYFHNFIYESVWQDNDRRSEDRVETFDILHRFGSDYNIIFVGDASMGRHEIAEKGGSVEHYNSEPGEVWLVRFQERFRKVIWLNPVETKLWPDTYSIQMIRRLMEDRMYHLSVEGIEQAMRYLAR